MKEINKATIGLFICLLLSLFMLVYVHKVFVVDNVSLKKGTISEFENQWDVDVSRHNDNYVVMMKNVLPDQDLFEKCLFLRTYHQSMQIFIEEECIFSYGMNVSVTFGNSVASAFQFIPLRQEYAGKEVRIYLVSAYKKNSKLVPEVLFGTERALIYNVIAKYWPLILETIAMFVISLTLILFWICSRKAVYANNASLYLGLTVFFITTWLISNTQVFGMLFGNVTVIMYMCYTSFYLIPVPMLLYFEVTIGEGYKKPFRILEWISIGYFLVAYVLQFLNLVNFKQILAGVHVMFLSVTILVIYVVIKRYKSGTNHSFRRHMVYCTAILFGTFTIDLVRYYFFYGNDIAAFIRVGMIIYILGLVNGMVLDSFDSIAIAKEATVYEKMAYTDRLTGLFNRTAYENDIKELDEMMKNRIHIDIVVICFDLNNLKKINDNMGHKQGDAYIKAFSNLLRDEFYEYGRAYRIGGDEFTIIMQNVTPEAAQRMVDILNGRIDAYNSDFQKNWNGISLSSAYGISSYQVNMDSCMQDIIERGDQEMYKNKTIMKANMVEKTKR